jgi:release factor glutamine methyltransferase
VSVSRQHLLQELKNILQASGCENSTYEARYCLLAALAISSTELLMRPDEMVSANEAHHTREWAKRRAKGEPLAHLVGKREFWGRDFAVNGSTLIPRPDSETLIEAVLTLYPDRTTPLKILDLGTGSGCLLITLLCEYKEARGIGVDLSPEAIEIASQNAVRHHVSSRALMSVSHWFSALQKTCEQGSDKEEFDIIVSNPPYIPTRDITTLASDVRDYEPHRALDGGKDGLDAYRSLIQQSPDFLKPKGLLIFEVGQGQADDVGQLMKHADFKVLPFFYDLAHIPRVVAGFKK